MANQGDKTVNMLRQLIKEVKDEMRTGNLISESKTPTSKKATMNEYVTKDVIKIIAESE